MTRAVYEKIGGLDERFGLGFFDDNDLAERARRAGFGLAVARDLFVHHFGSRTFQGNGVDAAKLLDENARRFGDKWGPKEASGKPVALRRWRGEGNGPSTQPEREQRKPLMSPPSTLTRRVSEGGVTNGLGAPHQPGMSTGAVGGASDGGTTNSLGASHEPGVSTGTLANASGWCDARSGRVSGAASASLTMIARDEQDRLAKCPESVRGLFDGVSRHPGVSSHPGFPVTQGFQTPMIGEFP
jgi:hypothetical protein